MAGTDAYEMSDDDFMNQVEDDPSTIVEPVAEEPDGELEAEGEAPNAEPVVEPTGEVVAGEAPASDEGDLEGHASSSVPEGEPSPTSGDLPAGEEATPAAAEASSAPDDVVPRGTAPEGGDTPAEVDYKAGYEMMMGTFKASGKDFTPRSPEEVVQLMQKGADYSKKMNALKPSMRMMRTLQQHDLLTEDKVNFLVDLAAKKPEAIQKLLSDAQIDPLDLDTSKAAEYRPQAHVISPEADAFQTALEDTLSTDSGKEIVSAIEKTWDNTSKNRLLEEPQLLAVMETQKAQGIYDQITAEIDHQRTLGNLQNIPFLQAYKIVGDHLQQQGAFNQPKAMGGNEPAPAVLETRPATPKPAAANGDQARAAGAARRMPQAPVKQFDPFAMSDEDFLRATETQF